MNVIFLDFDGTIFGFHDIENNSYGESLFSKQVEKRIAILAEVCKEYNCKIVIEAAAKNAIDEETMEIDPEVKWLQDLFALFNKYGIECIGRTPNVRIHTSNCSYIDMWKELEIKKWLFNHPEVEHYCILDDNDTKNLLHWKRSDLETVKDHLVLTCYYSKDNPELEGLQVEHKEEIGKVLKLKNEVQRLALKRKNK